MAKYDAATRAPLACIDVGRQAHAAFPSADESYVIVANENGKLLQRITTNYATSDVARRRLDLVLRTASCALLKLSAPATLSSKTISAPRHVPRVAQINRDR